MGSLTVLPGERGNPDAGRRPHTAAASAQETSAGTATSRATSAAALEQTRQPAEVRASAIDTVVTAIRSRWGQGTIVKLGDVRRAVAAVERRATERLPDAPAWWPTADGRRPRILELIAAEGTGGLSLSLTWLTAAKPTLAAIVDPEGRFYPPAAAACGVDLSTLIVVRPPAATGKLAFDACVVLLQSQAFDAVVCAMPAGATDLRASAGLASFLARLTAQSGTSLVLVSPPHGRRPAGLLASGADYRVRLVERRWQWDNGMLSGMVVRVKTERARSMEGGEDVEHELRLTMTDHNFGPNSGERFALRSSARLVRPAPAQTRVAEVSGGYG